MSIRNKGNFSGQRNDTQKAIQNSLLEQNRPIIPGVALNQDSIG